MTEQEIFNHAYHDYMGACSLINGMAWDDCYKFCKDMGYDVFNLNENNKMFDINFGVACLTIHASWKNETLNAYVLENSIEVYDDNGLSHCLGSYTIDDIIKLGNVEDE